jgi:tRNA A37 threonylcarbamoyladenosine dehydratase
MSGGGQARAIGGRGADVKPSLSRVTINAMDCAMLTREDKLAAKLRENLKRRKAQARAQSGTGASDNCAPDTPALPNGEPNG